MGHALPQRSCISCRAKGVRGEMLRFVCTPQKRVCGDVQRRLPGRGAYTCAQEKCLKFAVERGRFARSFRSNVLVPEWSELWSEATPSAGTRGSFSEPKPAQACIEAEPRLESGPLNVGPLEGSEHDED